MNDRPTIEDVLGDQLHPWDCPALQTSHDQLNDIYDTGEGRREAERS